VRSGTIKKTRIYRSGNN